MNDRPIDTEESRGWTIKVYLDFDPQSPREYDNLGQVSLFHRDYTLPDDLNVVSQYGDNDWGDVAKELKKDDPRGIIIPLDFVDNQTV